MNLEQIRTRAAEINARLSELDKEIDLPETSEQRAAEIKAEVQNLIDERKGLNAQVEELERQAQVELQQKGNKVQMEFTKRQALCYLAGMAARGKKEIPEAETRALGVALTTTATSYVAATSEVNGVNNGGILIPSKLFLDFLKEEGKLSPILNDIVFMNVKGLAVFPYRSSRTSAASKSEGASTGKNQFQLAKLELAKGWLQIAIDVTDEVEALSEIDLGAWLLERMEQDLSEDWAYSLIYGNGSGAVKGVTEGATTTGISSYTAGKELESVVKGVKLCKGSYRRGAKIYVAQDVFDAIAFAVDDNGNFKFPIVNGGVGVTSMAGLRVEVDENLADGDFVIGNVSKYYKANLLVDMKVESDRDINSHITTYVAAQFVAAAPFPGAFIHGSRAS